ncbi:MAG TPA: sigma-54 dependent transcriptional regulator [Myxococcota bacterium]|jgi:DNA-binding NtrC family response regulator|nr:sigma-54 dependent transcriptional regulator [Myxococcota bacterium]
MADDILIVEDEERYRKLMSIVLSDLGRPVRTAADGKAALEMIAADPPAVVLTDLRMPALDGRALLTALKKDQPDLPVIVITAFGSIESAVDSMKRGAYDYVTKPFEEDALRLTVARALEANQLRRQNRILREELERRFNFKSIIGQSPGMVRALELCGEVSRAETTVLVLGESGTGKELIARALHYNSRRAAGPFVALNCAAIPEGLLESELFGSERGAYTGAVERKIGRFEAAQGGTLFLDEIGDMDMGLQAKILRAIQEREFRRLGGNQALRADVRILCATNANLEALVAAGKFRRDLYYRVNVFPIELPPLRDRGEDVLLLARTFLDRFAREMGKRIAGISAAAEEWLLRQRWEGNVRELENLLERAVILCKDDVVGPAHLRPIGQGLGGPDGAAGSGGTAPSATGGGRSPGGAYLLPTEGIDLEAVEKSFVQQALEQARFNKTRAAKLLGLTRATLRYRIEKFGL